MPAIETTPIPGLLVVRLDLMVDERGWFKENWQREKMVALGLPDFGPVQNNVSFNLTRGVTRGVHTEPWDKLVSVAHGRAFGAWVDMREGDTFGASFHVELDEATAVFVPRGVGNSYQCLTDSVAYSYLVNEHWRPTADYPALDLGDPDVAIPWPIPLSESTLSEKDQHTPRLRDVTPIAPKKTAILGAGGQVGRALAAAFPDAVPLTRAELDVDDPAAVEEFDWSAYAIILNAAAMTAVDDAESEEGRQAAWRTNAAAPAALARAATEHRLTLVHFSSEYVYDGTEAQERTEEEPLAPLGAYAASKAAGDLAVATTARHYLLRTSWVIGEGYNFVRTMQSLAERGISPAVVGDQVGRLTFADELARAAAHLLNTGAPFGTYHVTNGGPVTSWHAIAQRVFALSGREATDVSACTTEEYAEGKNLAPRPLNSALSLEKLRATGFEPEPADDALVRYLS